MSLDRIRENGEWTTGSTLEASEVETIDADRPGTLHDSGGAYSSTQVINVGGKGIQDLNALTINYTSGAATATSNIEAHRVRILGGINIASQYTLQFKADADDTCRIITIDEMKPGTKVLIKNETNATIGEWTNRGKSQNIYARLERIAGDWALVAHAKDVDVAPSSILKTSTVDPLPSPPAFHKVTALDEIYNYSVGGNGAIRFEFSPTGAHGHEHRLYFAKILANTTLQFTTEGVSGGSFANWLADAGTAGYSQLTLTFRFTNGSWSIANSYSHIHSRRKGRTFVVNGPDATIPTNDVELVHVKYKIFPGVSGGNDSNIQYTLIPPAAEGLDLYFFFEELRENGNSVHFLDPDGFLIWGVSVTDQRRYPLDSNGVFGGDNVSIHFRSISGQWRPQGAAR